MEKKTTQTKKKETAAAASSSAIRAEKEAAVKAYKKAAKERTPQMPQQTRTPQNVRQEMQSIVDRASGRMQQAMNAQQETGKQEIQRTMQDIVSRAGQRFRETQNRQDELDVLGLEPEQETTQEYMNRALDNQGSGRVQNMTQAVDNTGRAFLSGIVGGIRSAANSLGYQGQGSQDLQMSEQAYWEDVANGSEKAREQQQNYLRSLTQNERDMLEIMGLQDAGAVYLASEYERAREEYQDKPFVKMTDMGEEYERARQEKYGETQGAAKVAGDLAQTIGQQMPAMALNMIPVAGQIASAAYFYESAAGSAYEEAIMNGATQEEALKYGSASGLIEAATEKMFDGMAGLVGAGAFDDVTESMIAAVAKNDTAKSALRLLVGAAGEGIEEVVSDIANPFIKTIYNHQSVGQNFSELDMKDMAYDFLLGALSGGVLGSVGFINGQNRTKNGTLNSQVVQEAVAEFKNNRTGENFKKITEAVKKADEMKTDDLRRIVEAARADVRDEAKPELNNIVDKASKEETQERWGEPTKDEMAFADLTPPSYEELIKKAPIKVVDVRSEREDGQYKQERKDFIDSEEAKEIMKNPVVNKDTGEKVFITKNSFTHSASNDATDINGVLRNLPGLIENAVFTHREESKKAPNDRTTGVYRMFAAAWTENGIQPVKITIKEFKIEGQSIPANVKAYIGEAGDKEYAQMYDGKVLAVDGIEIEKDIPGSALTENEKNSNSDRRPEMPSEVSIEELLKNVNSEARKYIPSPSERDAQIETEGKNSVSNSMTMDQARKMLQMAFNANNIREAYGYKTVDEWLEKDGIENVAMYVENTETVVNNVLNRNEGWLNEDYTTEDIVKAYAEKSLMTKETKKTRNDIDTSKDTGYADDRFYAPKKVTEADIETASQRVTPKNREEVNAARLRVLLMAHNDANAAEKLGMTEAELNKKLTSWSGYPAAAKAVSDKVNDGVAHENQWSGIQNCSTLSKMSVTDEDVRECVREITGQSSEYERQYIARTMLAIDTHTDWTGIAFEFVGTRNVSDRALGDYDHSEKLIRVGTSGPNTVAHEMGHALDNKWGEDLGYGYYLSEKANLNSISDPTERAFAENFAKFVDSICESSDISSNYTQRRREVFARFVASFVQWTDRTAGNRFYSESAHYRGDHFTTAQYYEFIKLLQEKSVIDVRRGKAGSEKRDVEKVTAGRDQAREEQRGKLSENEKNVFGKTGTTITGRRTRVKFTYAVVSLEELGTSHDPDGTVNENYPQELQPRDRSRVGSISETQAMSNAIVPELLEESMTAQNGAPIVTEDGNVIGGNKRVNALTLAYRNGRAVEYEQYLRDNAAKWGIDADAIPENPVLVRVTDHENAVSLARELNEQTTEASSATEAAKTDAERLTDDILKLLDTGEDDGADLNSKDNSAFIQAFIETLPESERAALITKNGKLNQAGIIRARNALIAKAYGDDARLAKIAEDIDPDAKNILNALAAAAPIAAKAQAENATNVNTSDVIMAALDIYEEAKANGMTMREYFDQSSMLSERDGLTAIVAKFIENNKRSGKKIRQLFESMYMAVESYDPNQMNLFGEEEFNYAERIEEEYRDRTGRELAADLGTSVGDAYREGREETTGKSNRSEGLDAGNETERRGTEEVTKDPGVEMTEGLFVNQEAKEEQAAEPADEEKTAGSWDDAVNEATEWAAPHEQQITEDAEANTEEPAPEVTGEDIDEENRRRLEAMFGTLPDEDAQTQEAVDRMAEELGDGLADIAAGQSPVQTEAGREKISAKTEEEKQTWKQRATKAWDAFKRSMVNQADSIHQMALKLKDPSMDGYFFYAKAHRQRANDWVTKKRTSYNGNKVGKSLNEIMNPIREKGDDYYTSFQSYMYHMLNVDRFAASNQEEVRTTQAALDMFVRAHPNIAAMTEERLRALERTLDDVLVPDESMQDAVLAREYLQLKKERDIAANRSFKPVFGYEVTGADSEEAAKKLLVDHPEFEQLAQEVYDYIDDLLQFRVDSGLITENDKKMLQEKYPHYVPAYYDTEQNDSSSWNGNANVSKTIRRAKGGNQTLKPLHTSLAQQTGSVMFNSGIEKLATKILDQYEANRGTMGQYVQEVKEMPHYWDAESADNADIDAPNSNVISVIRDGKRYEVTLDDGTAAAFRQLTEKDSEMKALNFMKNINDTFKKLCTAWNPLFMITNPLRDVQDALFYSTDTKNWAKNYAKTVSEIANNGEYWTMYSAMGGIGSSYFDWMTGETEKETGGIMGKIEAVNLYIEQMPRLAEFMTVLENAKKNHGEITEDDRMNAFNAAQEITTNFGRTGKYGSIINKYLVPFWNPSVQGMSKAVRTIAETKGAKAWVNLTFKAAALGILPSIINGMLYRKDDEWDKIKDSDKINYYLFKGKDGVWVKIPKGRVLAALSAGAVGLQEFARGDDVDWVEIGKTAVEQIAPNNPFENNIVSQMMRTDLFDPNSPGKTWYGSDIESQRLRKLSPGERYDESTDIISKWLGKQLNLSPKKISYLIDQYSGVLGDVILPYLTPKAERGVYIPVTEDVEIAVPLSNAFLSRFTLDTVSNNKISGEYYDMADELTYAKNDGSVSGTVASQYMSHAGGAISDIYSQIREIENDPNLTNKEKTELTRELRGVLNEQQMDIMANADRYRQVAEQFLQAYPELDYSSKDAVQAWMDSYNAKQSSEQYYIDADKATTKMKEELYREVNRITFGAEYALQTYNKDVYYKALELNQTAELSFDDYYQYYFASQYIYADKDENGNSISGSKKQKMVGLIDSMDVTAAQKDALFLAAGYGESTLGSTPWHGGEGVYVEEGGSGNGGGGNGGRRRRRGGGGGRSSGSATLRSLPGITGASGKKNGSTGSASTGSEMLRALFSGSSGKSSTKLSDIYKTAIDNQRMPAYSKKRGTNYTSERSGESAVQRYLRTGKL